MHKQPIETKEAPPSGHYNQGIAAIPAGCKIVYTSGMCGEHPASHDQRGTLVSQDIKEQTKQALENILAVIKQAGGDAKDIVRINAGIVDMKTNFERFDHAYFAFFQNQGLNQSDMPTRAPRSENLPWEGYKIILDAVAYVPNKEESERKRKTFEKLEELEGRKQPSMD